jgi:hypothetical protein
MLISENNIRRLARTMLFSESSKKVFEANYSPSNGGNGDAQGNPFSRPGLATKHDQPGSQNPINSAGLDQNNVTTKPPLPTSKHDLNVYVTDLLNSFVDLSTAGSEIGNLAKKIEDCIKGFA